jgi:hypothetical protein
LTQKREEKSDHVLLPLGLAPPRIGKNKEIKNVKKMFTKRLRNLITKNQLFQPFFFHDPDSFYCKREIYPITISN